ncbi:MAG: hypothetical protein QW543_01515 [Sulfolobales archaeon]
MRLSVRSKLSAIPRWSLNTPRARSTEGCKMVIGLPRQVVEEECQGVSRAEDLSEESKIPHLRSLS